MKLRILRCLPYRFSGRVLFGGRCRVGCSGRPLPAMATLFSLLISAYPFVNVVNARVYAIKILSTILLSNLVAIGFYHLRMRGRR